MLDLLGLANLLDASALSAPEPVLALAQERQAARLARDFARADELRDAIAAAGWIVRDVDDGFELLPSSE
jgi:cysteinyl-tRNA synthetase